MRLSSVSLCDAEADVLWLSEGALGPDEHSVVIEAIGALQADTSLPYFEFGMEDGRLAVFLAVRAPQGDLVGVAMILAEMKSVQDGVIERLVTPQVRTILQKIAVLLRTKTPTAGETGATVAMPTPAGTSAAVAPLPPNKVEEILTLELSQEPPVAKPAAPSVPAAKSAPAARNASAAPGKAPAPAPAKVTSAPAPRISPPAAKGSAASPHANAQAASAAKGKPAPSAPPVAAKASAAMKSGGNAPSLMSQVLPPSAMAELEFDVEAPVAEPVSDEITSEVPAVSEEFVLSIADTGMMQVIPASAAKAPAAKAAEPPVVQPPPAPAPAAKAPAKSSAPAAAPAPAPPAPVAKKVEVAAPVEPPPAPPASKAISAKVAAAFEHSMDGSEVGADLVLHVQELIKLRSNGRTRRYEVLARSRRDAAREEVPAAFIAESAKGKEGSVLDGFVVQRLLSWLGEHGDVVWDSEPASFSINLSIGALEDPKFAERIAAALQASEVPTEHIGFEITEFACVQCKPQVQRFVETCEQLGCFLVLDNFTFDPSSLQLLGSSALRAVKIDPKLTNIAMKDKLSQAIVVAIAQACKVMGVHCVAKRIDSQTALQWLTAVGCDFAQGYALEKPLPIDTLLGGPPPKRK
jgi:EAL domain-containing protein (putative c-di-GMP-specific phosphodiesterase class I)